MLIGAKEDGVNSNDYQSDVRQLVKMNRDVRKIRAKAVDVMVGLRKFEIQCTTDAADVVREMRYLGLDTHGLLYTGPGDHELLDVVSEILSRARDMALRVCYF